jgi:pimeloyl-ACP methyl ester carboxylesterase
MRGRAAILSSPLAVTGCARMPTSAIQHRSVVIEGIDIFYRDAGPRDAPVLLLLHGFPASSRQYVRLMERLSDRLRVIAPDYPGFGYSDAPASYMQGGSFAYSFDSLAAVIEQFCSHLRLDRFFLYLFDFGGPVGMRMFERRPDSVAGLVLQNANCYTEGLSAAAVDLVKLQPDMPGAAEQAAHVLSLEMTRFQYLQGAAHADQIPPEGWTLDQHFIDLPGRKQKLAELILDYHTNVARYESWQKLLRAHQPASLIVWGRNDPLFIEAGAHAYLRDLPQAELHLFDTGHLALEEYVDEIAALIRTFIARSAMR